MTQQNTEEQIRDKMIIDIAKDIYPDTFGKEFPHTTIRRYAISVAQAALKKLAPEDECCYSLNKEGFSDEQNIVATIRSGVGYGEIRPSDGKPLPELFVAKIRRALSEHMDMEVMISDIKEGSDYKMYGNMTYTPDGGEPVNESFYLTPTTVY